MGTGCRLTDCEAKGALQCEAEKEVVPLPREAGLRDGAVWLVLEFGRKRRKFFLPVFIGLSEVFYRKNRLLTGLGLHGDVVADTLRKSQRDAPQETK
jgi:hypothetical protein